MSIIIITTRDKLIFFRIIRLFQIIKLEFKKKIKRERLTKDLIKIID
jgi:hypothetical protein